MKTYNVGDIVYFKGNIHYADTNAKNGIKCEKGIAKVNMKSNGTHAYHLIAEPYGDPKSNVYGYVSENDITDLDVYNSIDRLAYLQIINSPDYWKQVIKDKLVPNLDFLLIKATKAIIQKKDRTTTPQQGIDNLISASVINSPDYWTNLIQYSNIASLLCALGGSVEKKKNNGADLRSKIIATAQSYLGYNEWDGSHREIIDIYNQQKPLPVSYKLKFSDSWCQCFVTVVFIQAGLKHLIYPECSCQRAIDGYINTGIGTWIENDAYIPSKADIIYYNWDDGWDFATIDNKMIADHVGIVVSCDGKKILVIEGNYQDQVKYRTIDVNGRFIRGFFVPIYES